MGWGWGQGPKLVSGNWDEAGGCSLCRAWSRCCSFQDQGAHLPPTLPLSAPQPRDQTGFFIQTTAPLPARLLLAASGAGLAPGLSGSLLGDLSLTPQAGEMSSVPSVRLQLPSFPHPEEPRGVEGRETRGEGRGTSYVMWAGLGGPSLSHQGWGVLALRAGVLVRNLRPV